MGYESYKLTAKFQNITRAELKNELMTLGAKAIEEFGSNMTLEMVRDSGIIEIVLTDVNHINLDFSPGNKVLMHIMFTKTSEIRLVHHVMSLLQAISLKHELVYIRDAATGRDVDCHHYAWLTDSMIQAKKEFERLYPKFTKPGRSRELFVHCRGVQPYAAADRAVCS